VPLLQKPSRSLGLSLTSGEVIFSRCPSTGPNTALCCSAWAAERTVLGCFLGVGRVGWGGVLRICGGGVGGFLFCCVGLVCEMGVRCVGVVESVLS